MNKIDSVLLADDHPLFRAGVRQTIEATGRYRVVAEVGDGAAALAQIEILRPGFAVLDLSMPGLTGFDALAHLQKINSGTRVLVVSMHAERAYAQRARELGAIGFVAKEDTTSDLISALESPADVFFMSQSVGASVKLESPILAESRGAEPDFSKITDAERNVLIQLSEGKTSKQIAKDLGISPRTVQAHRRNISEKMGIAGPNRLMELAIRHRARLLQALPQR